jgi:hypothetical protein
MKKIFYNKNGWVCQRYPYDIEIDDLNNFIEVDDSIYEKTLSCESYMAWKVRDGSLVIDRYEDAPKILDWENEKNEITSWLYENDWKINKVFIGEWSANDQRWLNYLSERTIKRNRLDEINSLIEKEGVGD